MTARLRDSLRRATAEAHEHLHRHALATDASGRVTLPAYTAFLAGMWRVHRPLETALVCSARYLRAVPDAAERRRADRIATDLAALGETPPEPLPDLELDGLAEELGVAYVLEGSTLGGQVLSRQLREELALDHAALTFLTGYGAATHVMWSAFVQHLDRAGEAVDHDRAAAAAVRTFELFDCVLRVQAWEATRS